MDERRSAQPMNDFRCRSCGNSAVASILDLGKMPLANRLLTREELNRPEPTYPLELVLCTQCTLAQITETVPPETLFGEYLYFTSVSETAVASARQLAERLIQERALNAGSQVIELASNDGYLLQFYKRAGIPVLGVEPARNIAAVAEREHGIPNVARFFSADLARELVAEGKRADVLHAHNVLAHVADTNDFVNGIRILLAPTGVAVIEVPSVTDMIDHCEFDQIYHEHLCYFSLTALEHLFSRHALAIADVESIPTHGGSLRLSVVHRDSGVATHARVQQRREAERAWGVEKIEPYRDFETRVRSLQHDLTSTLQDLKRQGKRIAAYGAPGKGTILLNSFGIGSALLDFVVDKSPHKQGRFVPGVHLPIHDPAYLRESPPDYMLLLVWNLAPEIMRQQSEYRERGGRFIIPRPCVEIV